MTSSSNVPAGMYPDPENPGQSRFWNGSSWEAPGAPAVLPAAEVAQVTKKPLWKRKWFLITAGIFAVLVLGSIASSASSTKTTNQPSAASLPITPSVPALVVPNLVGLPAEQVVPALTALGLTLGPTTYGPSDAPNNQVISQTPAAGTPGVAGGAVSVILSSGPAQPAPAAPAPVEAAPAPAAPGSPSFVNGVLITKDLKIQITSYKIVGAGKGINRLGDKPIISFDYSTTNISGDSLTSSTAWIFNIDVFQDNNPNAENELDLAFTTDGRFSGSGNEEIKKGGTVKDSIAYELDDSKTPVDVIAKELFGDVIGKTTYALK